MIAGDRVAAAVFALALAVHVALGLGLHAAEPLPGDRVGEDLVSALRFDAGVDAVKVLTDVGGSFPAMAVLAGATAVWAAVAKGRRDQALALVAGLVLLLVAVNVAKDLWGRERPEDPLALADGLAYPSGHAAYAVTWVACALVTGRRGLLAAAALVTMLAGATRLYLQVHFLTDVVGGFALGAAAFALLLRR